MRKFLEAAGKCILYGLIVALIWAVSVTVKF